MDKRTAHQLSFALSVCLLLVTWFCVGHVTAEELVLGNTAKAELMDGWIKKPTGSEAGCDMSADSEHIGIESHAEFGRFAPVFTLPDMDGHSMTLSELRGRDIVLVFGSIHCPNCAVKIPLLNELDAGFDEGGFRVIFVAIGNTATDVRQYIENKDIQFDVLVDRNGTVGRAYGVRRIPEVFIIDSMGVIRYCGPKKNRAIWPFLARGLSAKSTIQMGNCEEREPYLLYKSKTVVKPNEEFDIEIFADFSDCPPSERTYHVDLNADGIYEVSGRIVGDSFFIQGDFQQEGIHPIRVKVKDGYGTAHSVLYVHVTESKITTGQVRNVSGLHLHQMELEDIKVASGMDGVRKRRVVLCLGSRAERFWIDINLAYHVLKGKYSFTDEEIILLTYDTDVPASLNDFDVSWIDGSLWTEGTFNPDILQDTFQSLSTELDGDDWLFLIFDGDGSGYYGPRTKRPYWHGVTPDSIYEGSIDVSEYDDPDYKEDEFQTELIPSGQVNCVKYDGIPKGMDKFLPCFDYYPSFLKAGDCYYRFKVLSHFGDLQLIDGRMVSDSDIYIEKIISYAKCDLNRNTIIEANEVDLCDWDGDGITLMSYGPEYDEDDWHDRFGLEDNYHPNNTINGLYYCLVDKNHDNVLDLIGFVCVHNSKGHFFGNE
ncbi:MAG: TlpA family protein disulfide reductase [Phycisphaerae bacterium]|nr:TlpA family protein disulfide reductase [Phycisphaerae bacterium]